MTTAMLDTLGNSSTAEYFDPEKDEEQIIVIGSGPSGIRFAQELLARRPSAHLKVFGNEASQPYNRVQLSSLLADDIAHDQIFTSLPSPDLFPHFSCETRTIHAIDTEFQTITDKDGHRFVYDKLVLATGSRPHIPNIEGVNQAGVYTFRNLKDTEHLYARKSRARHVVIVGGGLLGIEAARALNKYGTKVTLVQQANRLMNRQLDEKAAALLENKMRTLGIEVLTGAGVRIIHGEGRVSGVTLRNEQRINCDTVLLCAGIKANLEIARNAKIKVGRGIVVDDQLRTSAPNVYAIGECCEHRGLSYGLVNPGYEQAAIAADILCGGSASYLGSLEVSRLKVIGEFVCSMGEVEHLQRNPLIRELKYSRRKKNIYRKIILHKGKIIGAMAVGDWDETRRVQDAYQQGTRIWPWQQLAFLLNGYLWNQSASNNPRLWPASAIICQCNGISQQRLLTEIASGCSNVKSLSEKTGAGTVCGSCKPLLAQLTEDSAANAKDLVWTPILGLSFLALLALLLLLFLPAAQVSPSVQTQTLFEQIWNDKYWKQVTGFSLLGLSTLGLLMSLKKRLKIRRLGDFAYWRLLHIALGTACLGFLFIHTGMHFGENLNQWLMLNFLSVIAVGTIAAGFYSLSHLIKPGLATSARKFFTWSHILVAWPLPVLIGIHILTVYYF